MKFLISFSLFMMTLCNTNTSAQGKLPEFSLKEIEPGKVVINWINPFKNCVQLSVQRSENNKSFSTIISARNPNLYQNGFTDTKSPKNKIVYYRIFYSLKGGKFFFSETHQTKELQKSNVKNNNLISSPDYIASKYVNSNNRGFIQIRLTETNKHLYKIIFYETNGTELFQIPRIDDPELTLDKTNFMHSGWFLFKLYEDDKVLEANKIFLK
ncbi:MAG: hypothetical protein K2Q21_00295 [Chitinophagaceae bacterium]|nr:hypothetical protein [Chitinophagaceae bacterium]